MKGKERGRGSREKMGFCEIKKEKKIKKRVKLVVGVKSEGERKLQGSFLTCKYLYNII